MENKIKVKTFEDMRKGFNNSAKDQKEKIPKESNSQCKKCNNACACPEETRSVNRGYCHRPKTPSCNCFTKDKDLDHTQCRKTPICQISLAGCYKEEAERGIPEMSCVDACPYRHAYCPENYTIYSRKFNKITLLDDRALEFIHSLDKRTPGKERKHHRYRKRSQKQEKLTINAYTEKIHGRLPTEKCKTVNYTPSLSYTQPSMDCTPGGITCGQLYGNKKLCMSFCRNTQMPRFFPYPYYRYPPYCYCPCPYPKNQIRKDPRNQIGGIQNNPPSSNTTKPSNDNKTVADKLNYSSTIKNHSTNVNLNKFTVETSDKPNLVSDILETLKKNKISPIENRSLGGQSPVHVSNSKSPRASPREAIGQNKSKFKQRVSTKETSSPCEQTNCEPNLSKKDIRQSKQKKTKRSQPPSTYWQYSFPEKVTNRKQFLKEPSNKKSLEKIIHPGKDAANKVDGPSQMQVEANKVISLECFEVNKDSNKYCECFVPEKRVQTSGKIAESMDCRQLNSIVNWANLKTPRTSPVSTDTSNFAKTLDLYRENNECDVLVYQ